MNYPTALFVPLLLIPIFSFVAVVVWADSRRREREAYYRNELLKKVTETHGGDSALAFLREEERITARRTREGLRLGGLVTLAVGAALGIFLGAIETSKPFYLVGLIPASVGVALLGYSYLLAPKE